MIFIFFYRNKLFLMNFVENTKFDFELKENSTSDQILKKRIPGLHILADFYDCVCEKKYFFDDTLLKNTMLSFVEKSKLHSVGSFFHKFDKGGVTGIIALSESHLSVHTWPETNYVTVDIFVCSYSSDNRPKAKIVYKNLCEIFLPQKKTVKYVDRS